MANQINRKTSHKLGANRNEPAKRLRKRDRNFAQSRDIHEDRGERQIKTVRVDQSLLHLPISR